MTGDCGDVTASLLAWAVWQDERLRALIQVAVDTVVANVCAAFGIPDVPALDVMELL